MFPTPTQPWDTGFTLQVLKNFAFIQKLRWMDALRLNFDGNIMSSSCIRSLEDFTKRSVSNLFLHSESFHTLADSTALWKPAVTIGHKSWCDSSVGCKIEKPSWSAVNYK